MGAERVVRVPTPDLLPEPPTPLHDIGTYRAAGLDPLSPYPPPLNLPLPDPPRVEGLTRKAAGGSSGRVDERRVEDRHVAGERWRVMQQPTPRR